MNIMKLNVLKLIKNLKIKYYSNDVFTPTRTSVLIIKGQKNKNIYKVQNTYRSKLWSVLDLLKDI